jgi:fermentation-respiration switch protein FrsA (DUF1100 family)
LAHLINCLSTLTLRSPFWRRSWKHRAGRLGLYAAFLYVGIALVLLALEDWFLYRASRKSDYWLDPPRELAVEDVALTSLDGTPIHAWWAAPPGWEPGQGAVLFCHGNGGNLSWRGKAMRRWLEEMRTAVLLFDYPGFGQSGGSPNESGCYAAGDTAYDWLTGDRKVPGERILLYGGSLGGAVATDLAARRPHRALLLVCAFTSFPDMAQKTFPWLPGRWLVRNQFDNLHKIATCPGPVFIAHGTEDALVPFAQGERLFAAAAGPKRFLPLVGFRHHDTPSSEFYPEARRFLREVESAQAVSPAVRATSGRPE